MRFPLSTSQTSSRIINVHLPNQTPNLDHDLDDCEPPGTKPTQQKYNVNFRANLKSNSTQPFLKWLNLTSLNGKTTYYSVAEIFCVNFTRKSGVTIPKMALLLNGCKWVNIFQK